MRRLLITGAASMCAGLLCGGASLAHDPMDAPESLRPLVGDSALIVFGRVSDIRYKMSEPTEAEPAGVPHTFVTYEISEVLRGEAPARRLTLRFIGGADGRGGVYMETRTPTFASGQQDVLFIEGGQLDECPLVSCVQGRFRVSEEERVYTGWGVPVVAAAEELLIGGQARPDLNRMDLPRPSFDALIERPEVRAILEREMPNMSMDELRRRYEAEAPERQSVSYEVPDEVDEDPEGDAPPIETYGPPLELEAFFDAIRQYSERVGRPEEQIAFADPNEPIRIEPPAVLPLEAAAVQLELPDEERREMEGLQEGQDTGINLPELQRIDPGQLQRPRFERLERPRIDPGALQRPTPQPQRIPSPLDDGEEDEEDTSGEGGRPNQK